MNTEQVIEAINKLPPSGVAHLDITVYANDDTYSPDIEIDGLKSLVSELAMVKDDYARFEKSCWYCADLEIGDPFRCEVKPDGHWHHILDPGDGLPSPCENSERLESVFAELVSELERVKGEKERLRTACGAAKKVIEADLDVNHRSGNVVVIYRCALELIDEALADTKGDNNDE